MLVSPDYPNFVCSVCESNLKNSAQFIQQIEQHGENWEMFLKGDNDIKVHTNEADYNESECSKGENVLQEIKIEYCEDIVDDVSDVFHSSLPINEMPSDALHNIKNEVTGSVSSRKRKLISQLNLSTEYDRTCKLCNEPTFPSMTRFYKHVHQQHPGHKSFSCDICGSKFNLKSRMTIHMKDRHSKFGKKHQCQFCAKLFYSDRELRGHEKIHLNERSYVCKLCGKCFNQKTILNTHLKSKAHNAEYKTKPQKRVRKYYQNQKKVYRCDLCVPPISFSSVDERNIHNSMHKTFECDVCKNLFMAQESLDSHKLKHSDKPRPFVCTVSIPLTTYVRNILSYVLGM